MLGCLGSQGVARCCQAHASQCTVVSVLAFLDMGSSLG